MHVSRPWMYEPSPLCAVGPTSVPYGPSRRYRRLRFPPTSRVQRPFIIGNPPFLGSRLFLRTLGEDYSIRLRKAYQGKVSGNADLVCYWFAKSRRLLAEGDTQRVGL